MCGIVGAVAQSNIVPVLLEGLRRLEYRGYDSCGIAYLDSTQPAVLQRLRSVARVGELTTRAHAVSSLTGIAHTRWATHGAPSENNAHPHFSHGEIGVVHNGIIENFEPLRERLKEQNEQHHRSRENKQGLRMQPANSRSLDDCERQTAN